MAQNFKKEYKEKYGELDLEEIGVKQKITSFSKQLERLNVGKYSSADSVSMAKDGLKKLAKNDWCDPRILNHLI